MQNAINWFEIPVADLDRAVAFYEKTLATTLKKEVFGGMPMAIFPANERGTGGALVAFPDRKPTAEGALVYLNAAGALDSVLDRLKKEHIVVGKTDIGDPGYIALIRDTEGNVVGLHQPR
jgi:predicted enzyme related to lactoylglutathione lyase